MMHLPQLTPAAAPPLRLPARFDPPAGAELAERLEALRAQHGFRSLLTPPDANAKLAKGGAAAALTLAPAAISGLEVCSGRSAQCSAACVLWHAGNGYRDSVRDARVGRTRALADDPQAFLAGVVLEAERLARGRDPIRGLRLNCASDLPYEQVEGFLEALPRPVALYDYTKLPGRIGDGGQARSAARPYRLAFSISERAGSARSAASVLARGGTAVLVVAGLRRRQADGTLRYHPMPREVRIEDRWWPAVGGDTSDRRDLDPPGRAVILAGKGPLELPRTGGDRVGDRFAVAVDSPDLLYGRGAAWRAWRR